MKNCLYYTANEVMEIIGISRGHAYKIVKKLNQELEEKGFIVVAGRVPKKIFCRTFLWDDTVETKIALRSFPQGFWKRSGEIDSDKE